MAFLPNWRSPRQLVSVFLMVLLFACGGGGSHPPLPPPEGSLRIYNDGNLVMRNLHVTRSVSSTWGLEQLAPSTLLPGESLTLTRLYPDTYDVEARFSDDSYDRVYDVQIQDGMTTILSMADTGNGVVKVFNNSGLTINEIYLTLSSASTWGPNQLDQPLLDRETQPLTGISPGSYDLKVVFANGVSVTLPVFRLYAGDVKTLQVD